MASAGVDGGLRCFFLSHCQLCPFVSFALFSVIVAFRELTWLRLALLRGEPEYMRRYPNPTKEEKG